MGRTDWGIVFVVVVVLVIGVFAESRKAATLREEAIERGCAGYNITTGVWEWTDSSHGEGEDDG